VRWLVIDCGTWLTARKVLIHPSAISRENLEWRQFVVALTKAQVEDGPELAEDQPISQQMEKQLYTYYGWDLRCRSRGSTRRSTPFRAYETQALFVERLHDIPHHIRDLRAALRLGQIEE